MLTRFTALLSLVLIAGCAGSRVEADLDGRNHFDKGLKALEKKRYLRAQEELNQAVISGAHTEWGDDAMFYLAEAYFLNEEYILAIAEYDRLIRRMPFTEFLEQARYRICESYILESPKYFHDQEYTQRAIDEVQSFLDDFTVSDYRDDALKAHEMLRTKLAQKSYETGILYIKMDEPEPAKIAFANVLTNYYDTKYFELAHLETLHAYCIDFEIDKARDYLEEQAGVFDDQKLYEKAESYIAAAEKALKRRNR